MMENDKFKPAKKKGWEKIQITKDLTLIVGEIRGCHQEVSEALTEGRFADALNGSLEATLKLQVLIKMFKDARLGRHGHDLRALIDKVEKENRGIWPHVLRTTERFFSGIGLQ